MNFAAKSLNRQTRQRDDRHGWGKRRTAVWALVLAAGVLLGHASPAMAALHEWCFSEIFSDETGLIQYIEMQVGNINGEDQFEGATLLSQTADKEFVFGSDLPSSNTANRSLLLGTSAFAEHPGAVEPDFVIEANFFALDGDTLVFEDTAFAALGGEVDSFSFGEDELPLDGLHALSADGTTVLNSPTNFDGQTGHVPEPTSAAVLGAVGLGLLMQRRRRPAHV